MAADTNGNWVTVRCFECNYANTVHHRYGYNEPHFDQADEVETVQSPPGPNPDGRCLCGCGKLAPVSKVNCKAKGYIKNMPMRFVHGHGRHQSFGRF